MKVKIDSYKIQLKNDVDEGLKTREEIIEIILEQIEELARRKVEREPYQYRVWDSR